MLFRSDDVVAYCGSGVSACLNVLAMERAGFAPPRLYVASWSGWSSDPTRPAETGDVIPDVAVRRSASDPNSGLGAVRALRRTRQRHRLAELEWFEALYRVYLAAFVFGGGTLFVSGLVKDTPVAATTADDIVRFGPGWLGLLAVVAVALGLRSGSRGGPLALEDADVRHVLLAPVDRTRALLRPAIQRVRTMCFAGAVAGAIAGQLAGRRLPGTEFSWALAGAAWGATAGALHIGSALIAHGMHMPRWLATSVAAVLTGWQFVSALPHRSLVGPGDTSGGLALWGERTRFVEIVPSSIAVLVVLVGLALLEIGRAHV